MRTRPRDESGYVLFGIVILIIILGISMTAAVPLWQKVIQRENEQELIWRGYQYMDAIQRYQAKFPGAYPPSIEVLVEQKFLRKAYEDPMTESGEWRVLRQMSPELQQAAQQQAARQAGITDQNRSRAQMSTSGGQRLGQAGQSQTQSQLTGSQFQSSIGRDLGDAALGGIVGVASASEEETFYKTGAAETYKEWLFVVGAQPQAGAVAAGPGAQSANPFGAALPPPPGQLQFRTNAGVAPGQVPGQPGANPGQNRQLPPGFQPRPPGPPAGLGGSQPGFGQRQPRPKQQQQQQQQQRQRQR